MLWRLLRVLLKRVSARVWTTQLPIGIRLGGHNIPQLPDYYLQLEIKYAGRVVLLGYLQYT